jgi:hypothetical protein
MVVVPPGVLISVSVFVDVFSPHPVVVSESRLSASAAQIMRFMGHISYQGVSMRRACFNAKPALAPRIVLLRFHSDIPL